MNGLLLRERERVRERESKDTGVGWLVSPFAFYYSNLSVTVGHERTKTSETNKQTFVLLVRHSIGLSNLTAAT